ncbi:hypothetical protein PQ610_06920 [Tardisphaera miroshnichenkoae]
METSKPRAEATLSWKKLASLVFRRSLTYGNSYLIISYVLLFVFLAILSLVHAPASKETSSALGKIATYYGLHSVSALLLSSTYTTLIPLFCIVGSMGPMMIFTADRDKGVLEYLMSAGANPSTFFASTTVASLGLVTILLVPAVAASTAVVYLSNGGLPHLYLENLTYFSIPMAYATVALESVAGMTWSALTRRRPGMNSPIGIAPVIGLVPILIVIYAEFFVPAPLIPVLVLAVSAATVISLVIVTSAALSRLAGERFLPTG